MGQGSACMERRKQVPMPDQPTTRPSTGVRAAGSSSPYILHKEREAGGSAGHPHCGTGALAPGAPAAVFGEAGN